eukprot:CAMPEP_0174375070 /NCGR_PEP_ID=MMETSP0811_2-20130205/113196_1 /TAXON_ID=73025 ORGANISM="Eutreptiella gymnastica-like, Strain CCMP1594" /NCGR_SAMPLE_ID=MMETSP0811_2 /ASSEMBLY_ACC=CAM_ASM_000667 /LENGTH=90 /DNA_ID=CAMNT_0015524941 /DNA_START=115 /DNA_END=387 /DNA_ORIENTATION=-
MTGDGICTLADAFCGLSVAGLGSVSVWRTAPITGTRTPKGSLVNQCIGLWWAIRISRLAFGYPRLTKTDGDCQCRMTDVDSCCKFWISRV